MPGKSPSNPRAGSGGVFHRLFPGCGPAGLKAEREGLPGRFRFGPAAQYAAAVAAAAAALAMTFAARGILSAPAFQAPFFLCAIVFSSWFGGLRPGLLTSLLSVVCIGAFFLPEETPPFSMEEFPRLFMLLVAGGAISRLGDLQKRHEGTLNQTLEKLDDTVRARTTELRATLDAATDGIFTADRGGNMVHCNARFGEMWGIPQHLLEAGRVREMREFAASRMRDPAGFLFRAKEIAASGAEGFDLLELTDGRFFERYSKALLTGGLPSGRVWSFRDVTERYRADTNARRLAAIVENSSDAIISKDLNGVITSWNPAAERIFGYRADEAVGGPISLLTPEELRGEELHILERLKHGKRVEHFETVRLHKSGARIDVSLTVSPLKNLQGGITGASKIARDITARKARETRRRAEETLRRKEAELTQAARAAVVGQITLSIAHEINQPLAAIVTNAGACRRWLALGPPDLGEAREALQRITRDGNRAAEVIRRLRALFAKGQKAVQTDLGINEVIGEIIPLMQSECARRGAALEHEPAEGLPEVKADRVQIHQVLMNLMSNGLDAMEGITDRAHVLRLETGLHAPDAVLITVRDSGCGLQPGQMERLFDSFYTTGAQGFGMGLSICRSIAEGHGGSLWAEPNPGGAPGTTLRFTLPLCE